MVSADEAAWSEVNMELPDAIVRYADKYLAPYRMNADATEIIPRYCPFCKGGEHGDQNTFA